jgi:hypothetical protein
MYKYSVVIKTGEAEIRAIENTDKSILNQIFPLIEITRGRKVTRSNVESYPFDKRLSKLKEALNGQLVAFDLTSEDALSCKEIDELYDPTNGYQKWVDFLVQIKNENVFSEIIPTILLNVDDVNFNDNLLLQVQNLKQNFTSILYRNTILDENCYDDFELLKSEFQGINLYVMVDCGYTPQASHKTLSEKAISRFTNIKTVLNGINANYIVSATSFPNNVTDIGNVESDTFSLSEIYIHNAVCNKIPNVIYGDYASINPKRNDTVTMAHGWVPRIDVALSNSIYYYRKKRLTGISAYASTYTQIAQLVVKDKRFPEDLENNWGIQQISTCAKGGAPSSTPRFWIAVRMNIHIAQQVKRLEYTKE